MQKEKAKTTYQETQQEEIMQREEKNIKYTLLKTFTAALIDNFIPYC